MPDAVLTLVEPVDADVCTGQETEAARDLRRIVHKAILARRFVLVHRRTVQRCLQAARAAARGGKADLAAALLADARAGHAEMQTCTRVARAFERQAEEMGRAAGVYRATGRAGASPASAAMAAMAAHSGTSGPAASVGVAGSPATRRTVGGRG